jgi:hypothetical protein
MMKRGAVRFSKSTVTNCTPVHTTNAIESLNAKLRRSVRSLGHFPSDEAALKLIWLQLRAIYDVRCASSVASRKPVIAPDIITTNSACLLAGLGERRPFP